MNPMDKPNNEEDELRKAAPTLFGMDKKGGDFKVPDGYFDTFHARLQDRIQAETAPAKKPLFGWFTWKVAVPVLSTCVILIGFLLFSGPDDTVDELPEDLLAGVEFTEDDFPFISSDDDLYLIDDNVFEEYLEEQEVLIAEVETNPSETDIEEDELIDYLLEAGIDLDDIVEEM